MKGADVFLGLSVKGAVTPEMVEAWRKSRSSSPWPIRIRKSRRKKWRGAHRCHHRHRPLGLSEPGQQRLGFPYIFRGALDVRATQINDAMKIAAAEALAALAREDVPDEVAAAYEGFRPRFGPQYIIPVPFDPRLISAIPHAVAKAAMESGVARKPIDDMQRLRAGAGRAPRSDRLDVPAHLRACAPQPRRVVFAEGEEEHIIRSAHSYVASGLGTAILVGREERVQATSENWG